MRGERAVKNRRRTSEIHGDFAFAIDAVEIVVTDFRRAKPIADENQFGFDGGSGIDACANHGFLTQGDPLFDATPHQREAALAFVELKSLELHRLNVTFNASRLEPVPLKLGR